MSEERFHNALKSPDIIVSCLSFLSFPSRVVNTVVKCALGLFWDLLFSFFKISLLKAEQCGTLYTDISASFCGVSFLFFVP